MSLPIRTLCPVLLASQLLLSCGSTALTGHADGTATCRDEDGDGFLDSGCGGTDCDDGDEGIHPDAVDLCDDGIDQNCDGVDATSGILGSPQRIAAVSTALPIPRDWLFWTGSEYVVLFGPEGGPVKLARISEEGIITVPAEEVAENADDVSFAGDDLGFLWASDSLTELWFRVTDLDGTVVLGDGPIVTEAEIPAGVRSRIIAAGDGFFMIWADDTMTRRVWVQRRDMDGEILLPSTDVSIPSRSIGDPLDAVWSGSELGVLWSAQTGSPPVPTVNFRRVSGDGALPGEVFEIELIRGDEPTLVWTGSGYRILWLDRGSSGVHDIRIARIGGDGSYIDTLSLGILGSVSGFTATWSDTVLALAWNESDMDGRSLSVQRFTETGESIAPRVSIPVTGDVYHPVLVRSAGDYGLSWIETEYPGSISSPTLYFARVHFCGD